MNPAPKLILIGPMVAGKTCIGRRLAERFTLDFVDVDQAIVDAAGASIPTIFEHSGEAGFRSHERQALARVLEGRGQLVFHRWRRRAGSGQSCTDRPARLRGLSAGQRGRTARAPGPHKGRPLLQRPDREQVLHDLAATATRCTANWPTSPLDTDPYTAADATAQLVVKLATQWQRQDLTA